MGIKFCGEATRWVVSSVGSVMLTISELITRSMYSEILLLIMHQ